MSFTLPLEPENGASREDLNSRIGQRQTSPEKQNKPSALGVANDELMHMAELCDGQDPNTLITVTRELSEAGVKEGFRTIEPREAGLDQFAIHGSLDEGH